MTAQVTKFAGVRISLGGRDFIVPALTLKHVKRYREVIANFSQFKGRDPSDEEIDQMLEVIFAAVSRNYPDLKLEELEELVDLGNLAPITQAIIGQSGLEPVKPGEPIENQ